MKEVAAPTTVTAVLRRTRRCRPLALLLIVLADLVQSSQHDNGRQECSKNAAPPLEQQRQQRQQQQQQCSLYMAPSTIPNAGIGIFTAHSLETGDRIGNGDLMIPIIDADLYHQHLGLYWMIDDYTWDGYATGLGRESEREDGVSAFGPGLDAAINCNLALINVGRIQAQFDEALHRSRDPGAGAISSYHNASTYAKTHIPAGAELFKAYGDDWFETRPDAFALLPLSKDFPKANALLRRFFSKFVPSNDHHSRHSYKLSEDIIQSLHQLIVNFPFESRLLNAIPKNFSDLTSAVTNGIESLLQPHAIRSVEELEATGRCLDNIQPGPSTLPQAGRGAFSTRFLPAGSVITGSPAFHIPTYEMIFMYDAVWNEELYDYSMNYSNIVGYQLLLNYCWGHPESTALLCPYGSGVNYINHANSSKANVKLQWAPDGVIGHNETWLKQSSVADWREVYTTKLAIDYVAVRDIQPGEELFVDYGKLWEDAWTRHVQRWEQFHNAMDPMDKHYQPAAKYNQLHANDDIRTIKEQKTNPYPFNLELRCHPQTLWYFGTSKKWSSGAKWIETKVSWAAGEMGDGCEIVERWHDPDGAVVYTVHILDEEAEDNVAPPFVARGVTRDFIKFGDAPYTTDMHLPWAFRHVMVLPEDMVPDNWRNMRK